MSAFLAGALLPNPWTERLSVPRSSLAPPLTHLLPHPKSVAAAQLLTKLRNRGTNVQVRADKMYLPVAGIIAVNDIKAFTTSTAYLKADLTP